MRDERDLLRQGNDGLLPLGLRGLAFSPHEVRHEVAREGALRANLLLGEGDPVVWAVCALDVVLIVEEGVGKAVMLELFVFYPFFIGLKELILIIKPRGGNALAHGEIDACVDESLYFYIYAVSRLRG